MSPQAAELLEDLETAFPGGASTRAVMDWFGWTKDKARGAIEELLATGLVAHNHSRISLRKRSARTPTQVNRAEIFRLRDEEKLSQGEIAKRLKVTVGVVSGALFQRRRKAAQAADQFWGTERRAG